MSRSIWTWDNRVRPPCPGDERGNAGPAWCSGAVSFGAAEEGSEVPPLRAAAGSVENPMTHEQHHRPAQHARAAADDPNALEPGEISTTPFAWAQMTALHWHRRELEDGLRIETASPELFKEGTAFASSRIVEKTADPELPREYAGPRCSVALRRSWSLSQRALAPTLLTRLIDAAERVRS